jgi:threonine synthase
MQFNYRCSDCGQPYTIDPKLKDRASFLVSAFAARHGIKEIVLASTGNAGSSMAGVGAAAGQKVTLFLPATAPEAKLIQALQYGATCVSDAEIIAAQARLSRTTGLFSEPAGAAAFAGFLKIMAELPPAAGIVILATGNGLKDSTAAGRGITVPAETIQSLSDITKGN